MFQKAKALFIFFILIQSLSAVGQSPNLLQYDVNSPYSHIGIGELMPEGSIRNFGMGGTGVSQSNPEFLNIINPALLINNRVLKYDSLMTIMDGSIFAEMRKINNGNSSQNNGTANFNSFHYVFPVSKRWVTAVGLNRYSRVSYSTSYEKAVSGNSGSFDSLMVTSKGSGGIYRAEFANAYRLNKHFNIGLSASYLFGSINNEAVSYLISEPDSITDNSQKDVYSGFLLRPGITFRKKLRENASSDSAIFFNIGVAYDLFLGVSAQDNKIVDKLSYYNFVISRNIYQTTNLSPTFPPTLRAGISFDNYSKWNIAFDFTYMNWSKYRGVLNETLQNSFTFALGVEKALIPVKEELEQLNPYKTKYIRAGMAFTKTPYVIKGQQVNDFSVSIGFSLPVGKLSYYRSFQIPRPKLNFAIIAGQRGSLQHGLVKDQYVRAFAGITINDKWFKRRRID